MYLLKSFSQFDYFFKYLELISYLKRSTKIKLIYLFIVMLINSLMDFLTIGALIPFFSILSNNSDIKNNFLFNNLTFIFKIESDKESFVISSLLFIVIIIISGFIKVAAINKINYFGSYIKIELGNRLFKGILYKDYVFHLNTNSSSLISSQIQQIDQCSLSLQFLLMILLSVINIFGILLSLFIIDFKLTLYVFIFASTFYLIVGIITRKIFDRTGKIVLENRIKILKTIKESLNLIRQVIIDDSYNFFISQYNIFNSRTEFAEAESATASQAPRYILETIVLSAVVFIITVLYASGYEIISSLAIFAGFVLGLQKLLPMFVRIFSSYTRMRQDRLAVYSVILLLRDTRKSYVDTTKNNKKELHLNNNLVFKNISFSYSKKEKQIFNKISLELKRGDIVGLVGRTGAGKTTFIDLLIGLLEPNSGAIYIDGKKMNRDLFREFRRSLSTVPQDSLMLDATIEENIIFGNSQVNIDDKLLKNVLKIANLTDFVDSLPYGLKTLVGEDGTKLSGGQRQRITIARALYKKHSLLILDEATNAVDLKTEKKILNNLAKLNSEITLIMIAHRLQTLNNCDYILEVKDGYLNKYANVEEYQNRN